MANKMPQYVDLIKMKPSRFTDWQLDVVSKEYELWPCHFGDHFTGNPSGWNGRAAGSIAHVK
jgi:hypothetical protein